MIQIPYDCPQCGHKPTLTTSCFYALGCHNCYDEGSPWHVKGRTYSEAVEYWNEAVEYWLETRG